MDFNIIRKSTGEAAKYAPYVVELYEKQNGKTVQVEDALKRLSKDAALINGNKNSHEILLCFKTDPYPTDFEFNSTTGEAIRLLDNNQIQYVIYTKDATRAISDFEQLKYPKNITLVTKIESITLNKKSKNQVDEEFIYIDLFLPNKKASKKGVRTGIQFGSGSDPMLSLQLIRELHKVVHFWKVGEHPPYVPAFRVRSKWKRFKEDAKAKGLFKNLGPLQVLNNYEIKLIPGDSRLLLIAPHGVATKPQDDINTDKLTRNIAKKLKCSAIVNDVISRLYLNFNKIDDAQKHAKFIPEIKRVLENPGPTLVVWMHGIDDNNLKKEIRKSANVQCLIGYGQGQLNRLTAEKKTVDDMIGLFKDNSIIAHVANDGSNYCGYNTSLMNQWIRSKEYKLPNVQSIQLEFKYKGIRDSKSLDNASHNIAKALSELVDLKYHVEQQPTKTVESKQSGKEIPAQSKTESSDNLPSIVEKEPEDLVVTNAFKYLKKIFKRHFHEAMLEVGQYLIKNFYGKVEYARNNKKPLLPLIKKLQANSGIAPSKTWVYDAVKLAIDEHDFKNFRTYGNLGHSQKVLLTHVDSAQRKRELVEEAVEGNYTVARLRERIREIKGGKSFFVGGNLATLDELKKLEPKQLIDLKTATQNRINKLNDELSLYQKRLEKISSVINQKEMLKETDQKAKRGFRDWTEPKNNINICTGCENDCVYCYAKSMAYRRRQVKDGHWYEMIIREKDVDKKRKLHNGIVGFPSTHDILPTNLEAYLIVLGKLLRAGNEVLIVSKPRLECIKRICEAIQFFKDKVLFRFTIGAMNDDILSFWEPNAPTYQERKACLEYALNMGFRTSVSMEPMLDTQNIEDLVADLSPLVSEDIWLGTMNHFGWIKKGADQRLLAELDIIGAGQTPEKLLEIDKIYESNPKIKWKTEAVKEIKKAKEKGKIEKTKSANRKFKGWEKVKIITDDGLEKEATAPIIISASRASDLPAFYGDWFMNRLRDGYLVKRYPRNPSKTEHISFSNTRLIVFWTKNPEPMFQHLDEIEKIGIGYYFQYTLNDYEGDNLEPNVPPLRERIDYFKKLSKRIGKERVIWRFDPLILTNVITREKLIEKVHGIMTQLSGFTEKLVISFMKASNHKKVVRNLNKAGIKYRDFTADDIDYIAGYLLEMGNKFGVEVATCAEEFKVSGIESNKCIDDDLIRRVFSYDDILIEFIGHGKGLKDPGQRPLCRCIVSKDIGEYHTCKHLCRYCYANISEKIVNRNFKMINQNSEMLLPLSEKSEELLN